MDHAEFPSCRKFAMSDCQFPDV